jgi:hypothetical protein
MWKGTQTDNGDGTKRVVVTDENGEVIYDMPADNDTVFDGPVEWSGR